MAGIKPVTFWVWCPGLMRDPCYSVCHVLR